MPQARLLVLLLVGVAPCAQAARINNFAGPFGVIVHSFEECEENLRGLNYLRFNGITMQNRTTSEHFFVGNVSADREIDYTFGANLKLSSWDPVSGWRPNAIHLPFPEALKAMETYLPSLWEDMKVIWGGNPTVPQGVHSGQFRLDRASDVRVFKNMIYGKYKVDFLLVKRPDMKRTLGCLRLMISVVPPKASA